MTSLSRAERVEHAVHPILKDGSLGGGMLERLDRAVTNLRYRSSSLGMRTSIVVAGPHLRSGRVGARDIRSNAHPAYVKPDTVMAADFRARCSAGAVETVDPGDAGNAFAT